MSWNRQEAVAPFPPWLCPLLPVLFVLFPRWVDPIHSHSPSADPEAGRTVHPEEPGCVPGGQGLAMVGASGISPAPAEPHP